MFFFFLLYYLYLLHILFMSHLYNLLGGKERGDSLMIHCSFCYKKQTNWPSSFAKALQGTCAFCLFVYLIDFANGYSVCVVFVA